MIVPDLYYAFKQGGVGGFRHCVDVIDGGAEQITDIGSDRESFERTAADTDIQLVKSAGAATGVCAVVHLGAE